MSIQPHPVDVLLRSEEIWESVSNIKDIDPFPFYPQFHLSQQDKDAYSGCAKHDNDASLYFLSFQLSVEENGDHYPCELKDKEEIKHLRTLNPSQFEFLLFYIP